MAKTMTPKKETSPGDKPVQAVSVQQLVDYCLLSGDIRSGFCSSSRMVEGTRGHQALQRQEEEGYAAEVPLSYLYEGDELDLQIVGRADGIFTEDDATVIEEIKTTTQPLKNIHPEMYPRHGAQAKCYAYIYAREAGLERVDVQVTYYHLDLKKEKNFRTTHKLEELEIFFQRLIDEYYQWALRLLHWALERNQSIAELGFPFKKYRPGQRELAVAAYRALRDGKLLFAQAPTGIGKTMATLFPAIKALGEGHASKIFYLTAKTLTRTVAEGALDKLREDGLKFKAVTLTAKDKICFNEKVSCNPEDCPWARGYYDKIKEAMGDIFKEQSLTRPVIEEYARKHAICPFEFSLDISLWVDGVICDYNYAFDPRAYLRRFFQEIREDYFFLIDEAHNLPDRAREMFSAVLTKKSILELRKALRKDVPKLARNLNKLNSILLDYRKEMEEAGKTEEVLTEMPRELLQPIRTFMTQAEQWLSREEQGAFREALLDFYFECLAYTRAAEEYDKHYVTCKTREEKEFNIKLFCWDPSKLLKEAMKRSRGAVLFSATLTPLEFFMETLGGEEDSPALRLSSPFPRQNLCLLLDDSVSTRYKDRAASYARVAQSLAAVTQSRQGNYLAFFPSYEYMRKVSQHFRENAPDCKVLIQSPGMCETEREAFLEAFSTENKETLMGFAVMGGIFGEGIDLVGDRLSGAIIVGVGLPQVCLEREIIRNGFQNEGKKGFDYAYVYPGINKVLQAAGRVIRTETDKGVVLLIDERFANPLYRHILPPEWNPLPRSRTPESLSQLLKTFWKYSTPPKSKER
jgi:DNA excision repair protein ERCC-2